MIYASGVLIYSLALLVIREEIPSIPVAFQIDRLDSRFRMSSTKTGSNLKTDSFLGVKIKS